MEFLKKTRLYSILTGTCPVCHKHSMYEHKNPFNFAKTLKLKERCEHCMLRYNLEPSFFFGAMYVSYGLGVAIAIAVFIITFFLFSFGKWGIMISISATLVALMPFIQRLSRNIWINLFIGYNDKKANNTAEQNRLEEEPRVTKK